MAKPAPGIGKPDSRLFDMLTRQQMYLMGVSHGMTADTLIQVEKVLEMVVSEIRKYPYKTLGEGTQKAFRILLGTIIANTREITNPTVIRLTDQLKRLTGLQRILDGKIMHAYETESDKPVSDERVESIYDEKKDEGTSIVGGWLAFATASRLWASLVDQPLGTGGTIGTILPGLEASMERRIVEVVRRARAANLSVEETVSIILGTADVENQQPGMPTRGLSRPIQADAIAAIITSVQAVTQAVAERSQSVFGEWYIWESVLDGRTTDYCRSQNGRTYQYGNGPVPPAHWRCRSRIRPYRPGEPNGPQSLSEWVTSQPATFVNSVYDAGTAKAILNGTADRKMLDTFEVTVAMTLEEYQDSIGEIIRVR